MADVIRTVSDLRGLNLDAAILGKLRFKEPGTKTEVPPFSTAWIRNSLLAKGALARMSPEARLPLLVMVNTGARPSEILGAAPGDWVLDHKAPHLRIAPGPGRALKTVQS